MFFLQSAKCLAYVIVIPEYMLCRLHTVQPTKSIFILSGLLRSKFMVCKLSIERPSFLVFTLPVLYIFLIIFSLFRYYGEL